MLIPLTTRSVEREDVQVAKECNSKSRGTSSLLRRKRIVTEPAAVVLTLSRVASVPVRATYLQPTNSQFSNSTSNASSHLSPQNRVAVLKRAAPVLSRVASVASKATYLRTSKADSVSTRIISSSRLSQQSPTTVPAAAVPIPSRVILEDSRARRQASRQRNRASSSPLRARRRVVAVAAVAPTRPSRVTTVASRVIFHPQTEQNLTQAMASPLPRAHTNHAQQPLFLQQLDRISPGLLLLDLPQLGPIDLHLLPQGPTDLHLQPQDHINLYLQPQDPINLHLQLQDPINLHLLPQDPTDLYLQPLDPINLHLQPHDLFRPLRVRVRVTTYRPLAVDLQRLIRLRNPSLRRSPRIHSLLSLPPAVLTTATA